jgi:hypothetical protein
VESSIEQDSTPEYPLYPFILAKQPVYIIVYRFGLVITFKYPGSLEFVSSASRSENVTMSPIERVMKKSTAITNSASDI